MLNNNPNPLRAAYPELDGRTPMEALQNPAIAGAAAGLPVFTGPGGVAEAKTAEAARAAIGVAPALQTDVTIYVSPTGSDMEGDGSPEAPYVTIQKAIDAIPAWMDGHDAIVQIAPGDYTENILIKNKTGGTVALRSESATSAVTIGALKIIAANVRLRYMTLRVVYNSTLDYTDYGGTYKSLVNLDMGARVFQECSVYIDGGSDTYICLGVSNQSNWGIAAASVTAEIKNTRASDGIALAATNGASICLGRLTLQEYKSGIYAIYLGSISYVSLAQSTTLAGTTLYTTAQGGRVLLGANADTANYQY